MNNEFPLADELVYLNHAAIGPIPKRSYDAIQVFTQDCLRYGATHYRDWEKKEQALRNKLACLINAKSGEDIALLKNTSEALSVVAYGIDWRRGDNIVLANNEFLSNRIVWQSLKERYGVETKLVGISSFENPESELIDAIDHKTRLLTSSSVHYDTGLQIDLEQLGDACQQRNVLFCVDAIQSLGVVPFDVQACQADFVMADGHKWLLSPEGVALFYCRPQLRASLKLNQFGWRMVANIDAFQAYDWQASNTAKRFEAGSLNSLGIHAMDASLSLLQEIGIETIYRNIIKNSQYLIDIYSDIEDILIHSPVQEGRYAGIFNFSHKHIDSRRLYEALMKNNVICSLRGPGIRFSPHFYQGQAELNRALNKLKLILEDADKY